MSPRNTASQAAGDSPLELGDPDDPAPQGDTAITRSHPPSICTISRLAETVGEVTIRQWALDVTRPGHAERAQRVLPGGRRGCCHAPWAPFPSGSMHRWFPAVVAGPPISVSKRPLSCKNLVGAVGFEPTKPLACKAKQGREFAQLQRGGL